jgi:hypothetical protein
VPHQAAGGANIYKQQAKLAVIRNEATTLNSTSHASHASAAVIIRALLGHVQQSTARHIHTAICNGHLAVRHLLSRCRSSTLRVVNIDSSIWQTMSGLVIIPVGVASGALGSSAIILATIEQHKKYLG